MNIREAKEAHNGAVVKVQGYISEIRQVTASTGTEYMQFTIRDKEGTIQSKIWSGKLYDDIKNNGFSAGVYEIDGKINEYNGTKSIITNGLHGIEDANEAEYLPTKYDIKVLRAKLKEIVSQLSPEGQRVFKEVMTGNDFSDEANNLALYSKSVASVGHHDACLMGLMAHSLRVTELALDIYKKYKKVQEEASKDVIVLGGLLHDIGKIAEYEGLKMSDIGKLCSHQALGIEFLRSHQDMIVDNLGTETYFRLHSVITQHHGEYGDRPRTIEAYIVHKADSLEAVMTQLEESLENSMNGDVIQQDGNLRVFLN